jgi:hypothetical protein
LTISRVTSLLAVAAALLLLAPGLALAQAADPVTVIPAVYSSDRMTRNADLSLAGAVLATTALERAIAAAWSTRPDSATARTTRLARFLLFDVPVVTFAMGLNHEGGHIARSREKAFDYTFAVVGSPWSARPFELIGLSPGIFDDLGSQAGGFEASRRLKDRSEALLWHADRVAPGHALAAIIASLDLPVYAWQSLAPGNLAEPGDPARILSIVVRDRDAWLEFDDYRSRMRRRASWNVVDSALWMLTYGLVRDHLWRGDRGVPVRWLRIGGAELLPGVRYEWTSIGAEYALRSHYRAGEVAGLGYVRWTERFGNARQFGTGGSASWDINASLRSRVDLDLWSHTRDGGGAHGAVSVETDRWAPGASSLIVSAGAKSQGHVSSLPPDAGVYVTTGMLVRVW